MWPRKPPSERRTSGLLGDCKFGWGRRGGGLSDPHNNAGPSPVNLTDNMWKVSTRQFKRERGCLAAGCYRGNDALKDLARASPGEAPTWLEHGEAEFYFDMYGTLRDRLGQTVSAHWFAARGNGNTVRACKFS